MKPRIPSGSSYPGSDRRYRLPFLLVAGLVAQAIIPLLVLLLGALHSDPWLLVLVGIAGEAGILWLIVRAWSWLARRMSEQDSAIETIQTLASSLDLNAVAQGIVSHLQKTTPVQRVLLYRWYGEHAALSVLARVPEMDAGLLPAHEEEFKQVVAGQRLAYLVFSESPVAGRWWVVPLYARGRALGVVALHEQDDRALTAHERRLVEGIAHLASVALYNAMAFSQTDASLHERIIELSTIEAVSRRIEATLDVDVIANDVLAAVMSTVEAEVGCCLLKANGDEYEVVARIDVRGTEPLAAVDVQRGIAGQVLQSRKPVLVADAQLDPDGAELPPGMRSLLCVPILREGLPLGVLCLESSQANVFTESHVRLVSTLAEHAAIAMENARLYSEIRSRRDQLQAILDSTRDAVLLFDNRGRLLQFNPVAQQMLERPLGPYLGRSFLCWLRDNGSAHLQAVAGFTLRQFRRYVVELMHQSARVIHRQFQHVSGEEVTHISETRSPVLDQHGNVAGWLVVWRDNTEERRLDMLRQEFSSMVVHDLRNPITSVIGGMAMLHDLLGDEQLNRDALFEVVQIAQNSAENMLNLVQSLLDISRLEQSTVTMDCESLPLADSVDRASRSVLGLALEAGISITTSVSGDLPPVWMDDEKIQRVLINLLDNALRHTPQDGQITVEAAHNAKEKMVAVRVIDTGPGIPTEARDRIFDKFVQLDPQLVLRGHKGTGLGLTFCKLVIEAHGGRIWVEDGADGGAAFCFTLPVAHMHSILSRDPE